VMILCSLQPARFSSQRLHTFLGFLSGGDAQAGLFFQAVSVLRFAGHPILSEDPKQILSLFPSFVVFSLGLSSFLRSQLFLEPLKGIPHIPEVIEALKLAVSGTSFPAAIPPRRGQRFRQTQGHRPSYSLDSPISEIFSWEVAFPSFLPPLLRFLALTLWIPTCRNT